jgi:hypothetical protein
MVAKRHTVWADVLSGTSHGEIWRFDGASPKAQPLARADELNTWATRVSADGSSLWTVRQIPVGRRYSSCASVDVVEIDGRTGAQTIAARVPIPGRQCYDVTYSTFAGGAFFFLFDNRLYRVAA